MVTWERGIVVSSYRSAMLSARYYLTLGDTEHAAEALRRAIGSANRLKDNRAKGLAMRALNHCRRAAAIN